MLEHGVEDNEQLTHARCESQLLGLAGGQQTPVEVPDDWVVLASHQRPHVQDGRGAGRVRPRRSVCLAACRCLG